MEKEKIFVMLIVGLSTVLISAYMLPPASAHVEKTFGNVNVKVGLANEPPLVGDTNQIQIGISKGNGSSAQPIADTGLDNVTVTIKYGGITKTLSPTPSDDTPGQYLVTFIPSQLGSYYVILKGTVEGQAIDNGSFALDQVEGKDGYYFPPASGTQGAVESGPPPSSYSGPGPQFSSTVNQLANDINDAKNLANSTNQNVLAVQQSYQKLKNVTDELFMVSGIGIGTGVAGIVIAVYTVNRRNGSRQP